MLCCEACRLDAKAARLKDRRQAMDGVPREEAEVARLPLQLLELPLELLEKAVVMLRPEEWGSFAIASKATKDIAEDVVGDVVNAEVSRLLVAGELVDNILCARWPAVEVRHGVTVIGEYAFEACFALVSLTLPDSLTTIEDSAFEDCTSLTSLTLPTSLTTIPAEACRDCRSLVSLTLPGSLTTIGYGAFERCSSLTSPKLPDSLTTIGYGAFRGCTSLNAESRAAIAAIDTAAL
jgi:hypothetical protein